MDGKYGDVNNFFYTVDIQLKELKEEGAMGALSRTIVDYTATASTFHVRLLVLLHKLGMR